MFEVFCPLLCVIRAGTPWGRISHDVVHGALAAVAGTVEEESHQVPVAVPAHIFRQACAEAAPQETHGSPGAVW